MRATACQWGDASRWRRIREMVGDYTAKSLNADSDILHADSIEEGSSPSQTWEQNINKEGCSNAGWEIDEVTS